MTGNVGWFGEEVELAEQAAEGDKKAGVLRCPFVVFCLLYKSRR